MDEITGDPHIVRSLVTITRLVVFASNPYQPANLERREKTKAMSCRKALET